MQHRVVLLTVFDRADLARLQGIFSAIACDTVVARSNADLERIQFDAHTILVAFGSGVAARRP